MFSKMINGKRDTAVYLWIATMLIVIAGLATNAISGQRGYGMAKYHETHLKAGINCEYCHVNPYKPAGWIEIDKKGTHIATEPTNSKRILDKHKCLECHEWGQKAFYGPVPADAGSLFK